MKNNWNNPTPTNILIQLILIGFPIAIGSGCGNSPQPPVTFFVVRTTYKTTTGQDLLNQSLSNSFKQSDIKVISRIDFNGVVKEVYYNEDDRVIPVYFDNELKSYYFDLSVPTNAGKSPIETIVTLSKTDSDTVTYTYGPTIHRSFPDRVFYNKVLVWEAVDIPREGKYPPISVIK
jgi:hypothetical protein